MSWLEDERSINYTYGKMNELLSVTDPDGKRTAFEYDALGREMTKNLPNGVVTQTSYDPAGRITSIKNGASQRWGHDKTLKSFAYLYNEAGERTYQIEETGQITAYEYDGAGRIENVYYPFISGKKSEDFSERLELGLYPEYVHSGSNSNRNSRNRGHFGGFSNGAFQFDIPNPYIENYNSNEFKETLKGFLNDKNDIYKEYRKPGYSGNWHVEPGEGATEFASLLDITFEAKQDLEDAYSEISPRYSWGLNTDQWMWTETFTYDGFNNRESKANGWGKVDYTYNPANEILTAGNRQYEHDLNGNLSKETLGDIEGIYTYNPENKVTNIYSELPGFMGFHGQSLEKGVRYEYDALGRRSSRVEYEETGKHNWNWNKESNQNYLYDGLSFDVLAEFRDTDFSGNTNSSFGWGGWNNWNYGNNGRYKPVSEYVKANGDIVSRTDFNENSSRWGGYPQWKNKEYYSEDVLGSVIMLTDSRGNTKDTYSYDAFGSQYGDNVYGYSYGNGWTTGVVNEYGYNGKRFDSAVGLADYGFRDYAPQVGRFTTLDPIKDGSNWYVYVGNDPVNKIDPWGLSASDAGNIDSEEPILLATLAQAGVADIGILDFPGISILSSTITLNPAVIIAGVAAAVFTGDQLPTHIYRMGSGNATNLTPRVVDTNGLSYMLDRPTSGPYTVTTMQQVNATEVLGVVVDGPRHVSVMATSNQMMADWIESRSTALDNPHLLTTILQGISIKVK